MPYTTFNSIVTKTIPKAELIAIIRQGLIAARDTFEFKDDQSVDTRIFKSYHHQATIKTPAGHHDIIIRAAYFTPQPNWDGEAFYAAVKRYFEELFAHANHNIAFKEDYFRPRIGDWRSSTITTSKQILDPGLFTKKANTVMLWGTGLVHAINIMLQFPARQAAGLSIPPAKNPTKRERSKTSANAQHDGKVIPSPQMKRIKSDLNRTDTSSNFSVTHQNDPNQQHVSELEQQLKQLRQDNKRKRQALVEQLYTTKKPKDCSTPIADQRHTFWHNRVAELKADIQQAKQQGEELDRMKQEIPRKF